MRTSFLQDLYLQRPVTLAVLICIISILPWIGMNEFATKGEPREAAVAVSMLQTGNLILPTSYADEFAYKPPMAHWLMAAFSYPQGYVSEFTSRLPSAIAFFCLIGMMLVFFGKRVEKFQEAFIAICILITCVEIHRAGMTTRVDMLLTTFMVAGLIQLYRWEDHLELKGLPVLIPIWLGCAVLTKGPVGAVLPLFVFFIYLLVLKKYRFKLILKALLYAGISSLFLPAIWYIAAWRQGGDEFLEVVLAENFGRFFHLKTPDIEYTLGHERGAWYNLVTLFAGFIPWSILCLLSLFGFKIHKPDKSFKQILKDSWKRILAMEKVRLFSLVTLICIIFFYSIPSSKRSVYLMPAYPFIALFLAQYFLYLAEYRTKVIRVFAIILVSASTLVWGVGLSVMAGWIQPVSLVEKYTSRPSTLFTVETISQLFTSPQPITIFILILFTIGLVTAYYQLFRKINIKILYATFGLMFCVNLVIDGIIMRGEKKSGSSRPFARHILKEYPIQKGNIYVMNDLKEYYNLYGLNFYMGNIFSNFETSLPEKGYFVAGENDLEKVKKKYGDKYTFRILTSTDREIKDVKQKVVLTDFSRIN